MYTVRNSLALPALGGQIKSKMIHQLDSSRPGSVAAAAAAAASTARQLTISTGHTGLLYSVALTHRTVSDRTRGVQSGYQRRRCLSRTTKMTEMRNQEWHDHNTQDEICPSWLFHLNPFQGTDQFLSQHAFCWLWNISPLRTSWDLSFLTITPNFKHISASVIKSQSSTRPPENRAPQPLLSWGNRCHLQGGFLMTVPSSGSVLWERVWLGGAHYQQLLSFTL